MTTGIIIQARINSTRFKAKIFAKFGSSFVLQYVIDAAQATKLPWCLAVPYNETPLFKTFCGDKINIIEGPEEDVLSRFIVAAQIYNFDHIIRVTSDCPLISPELILACLKEYIDKQASYLTTTLFDPRTYVPITKFPSGFDVEIFSTKNLLKANEEATKSDREHVTPYFRRKFLPTIFNNGQMYLPLSEKYSIDTKKDLVRVANILKIHTGPYWRNE